jgi:hypothetical protein
MRIKSTDITTQDRPVLTIETPAGQPDIVITLWLQCGPRGYLDANGEGCAKDAAAVRAIDVCLPNDRDGGNMDVIVHTNNERPEVTENPTSVRVDNPATVTARLIA